MHWKAGAIIGSATYVLSHLFGWRKDRRKHMEHVWTDNNDGLSLPSQLDASYHSGATDEEIAATPKCDHSAGYTRGVLPGGRFIKHCISCGAWFDISREEYDTP